jgi:ubiquinone/menaquinone biosynthesis C-methylase UbiE
MTTNHREASTTEEHSAPLEAWDAIAEGYDRYVAPQEVDLANEALRLVALEPGERFLDVAAGPGGLSLPAARLGAKVLATDWSPAMIERFEARVREDGLRDAEGRVMDCHGLDLTDDSFDVTGSQFGVMLVPDQPRALREMVRVTKPGGRLLVIAYGPPPEIEFLQVFISALKAVAPDFPGLPDDPPPLEFQVSDPEVLRQRLTDAEGRPRRTHGRAARVRLGAGDVGLGALRQPDPRHAGSRPQRGSADETPPGPRRHAPRARRSKRAGRPHERGEHRHRDEVSTRPFRGSEMLRRLTGAE